MNRAAKLSVVMVIGLAICFSAMATPSGLNNIPTVDVTPQGVLVLQGWGNFMTGMSPSYFAGLKFGLPAGIEAGIDSFVDEDDSGPLTAQVKWKLPLGLDDTPAALLVGVANISGDSDEAGEIDPYVVGAYDFNVARLNVGYSFQKDNGSVFAGLDKTLKVQDRDLVLRSDVRQVNDGDDLLISAGALHVLPCNFVLESWISVPTESHADESLTVKLNYVISF